MPKAAFAMTRLSRLLTSVAPCEIELCIGMGLNFWIKSKLGHTGVWVILQID